MVCVGEFARAVVARGTTAVVADPHEIANVAGVAGIRFMLRDAERAPLQVFCAEARWSLRRPLRRLA